MPRIRTIKPDFWKSRAVKKLTDRETLVWLGIWNYADDYGRILDEPVMLVGELWALGLTVKQMDDTLTGLDSKGRIVRYQVGGDGFIQVVGWSHQKISHPTDSNIPPFSFQSDSGMAHDSFVLEGKGRDSKGGEALAALSPFCSKHPGGTDKACRACGNARRAFDAAQLAERSKPTLVPKYDRSRFCVEHEDYPLPCDLCARLGVAS